jgi:monovalent cation:H+ antiporter, CPA1 family
MSDQLTVDLGTMLLVASLVAIVTRRLRLPYSVGLVAAGIALALAPIDIGIPLSPDSIYDILLPPLIFEAALRIKWQPFRRELPVVLLLAFAGVGVAAAIVAAGMHLLIGWGWLGSALFGVLIAATDPVSVIAAFKELRVQPRLSLLVEAESLLNDGAAAVGFTVLVAMAAGSAMDPPAIAGLLLWKVAGGVIAGAGVAGLMLLLSGRTDDHLVEITLTTIAAYGAFTLAEHFAASGVLAAMAAGMVVGNVGWRGSISEAGREHLDSFWEYAAFLANSLVFILIGLHEAHRVRGLLTLASAAAIILALLSRAASVYALCSFFGRTRLAVSRAYQHVLVWGGLRGALALVLALTLPSTIPEQRDIVLAAFAVVAFSIFVQGLTMPPLLNRMGLRQPDGHIPGTAN